ncbi:MAG: hypothetical protein HY563_08305 [Ignavibacteriales bacterium]|nr:hypothetical protein [Ignavibacteriales bacterium]
MRTNVHSSLKQAVPEPAKLNPLLVFSPDPDVARSLTMLLEDHYVVESETDLTKLEDHANRLNPPILLADLHPFPPEILKTVEVLRRRKGNYPVIIFHVFRNTRPEIEQAIRTVSDIVLYKPINTDLLVELISVLMAVHDTRSWSTAQQEDHKRA